MVLFGAFVIFFVYKKKGRKKTVPKWLEWMYFCLCTWRKKRRYRSVNSQETSSVLVKAGKVSVWWPFCVLVYFYSHFFVLNFIFNWAFLHHNKSFLLAFIESPWRGKAPVGATMKPSRASVRPADTVLLLVPPPPSLVSTFWVLIALTLVTLQAKST